MRRSKIKFEENGKSATIRNPDYLHSSKCLVPIQVDGCVVTDGTRADFVVEGGNRAIVVELKGRDVERAAKQVTVTAQQWKDVLGRCGEVAGLIVAERYPKSSSKIQIQQNEFRARFLSPLHVVCQNAEYDFESVFTFRPLGKV